MEYLFEKYHRKLERVPRSFKRYLHDQVDFKNRLIGIKGARGAGKTTFLLQHIAEHLPQDHRTLYTSLDDLYFTENRLVDLADEFVKKGGQYLLLDEVHRYPGWSQELKNIYDDQPDLTILFTGSSIIHLDRSKGDLSRRAVMYELYGLSFREYLNLAAGVNIQPVKFEEMLKDHVQMSREIVAEIRPLEHLGKYWQYGYYPYFLENESAYPIKLAETISLALQIDLPALHEISPAGIEKIRLLLHVIAGSVPFKPNISVLSERVGVTRNTLIHYLRYLEDLRIVRGLYPSTKGIGILQKPEKLFLYHPNLHHALAGATPNVGNLRESFFISQLAPIVPVTYTSANDMSAGSYQFEIGGKEKQHPNPTGNLYIARDDIETGHLNKVPLWMFGMLY